jgi:CheY-like chemotaxis protein
VNALDAMPDGGRLVLRTFSTEAHQVVLVVEDTGQGMPPEVLSRAVEPFFTTKPVGKGTGLGLSRVFGTVQAHGGALEIDSRPGQGTRVTIRLPVAPPLARAADPVKSPAPAAPAPRSLRVLLVDDDPLVRRSAPALLAALGHQVSVVPGGLEALSRLDAGEATDVVLLDMSMPVVDGIETLARLRRQHPSLPVVAATGYADERLRSSLAAVPGVSLLLKPYSADDLRRAFAAV